jgi:hypothetical protein
LRDRNKLNKTPDVNVAIVTVRLFMVRICEFRRGLTTIRLF